MDSSQKKYTFKTRKQSSSPDLELVVEAPTPGFRDKEHIRPSNHQGGGFPVSSSTLDLRQLAGEESLTLAQKVPPRERRQRLKLKKIPEVKTLSDKQLT